MYRGWHEYIVPLISLDGVIGHQEIWIAALASAAIWKLARRDLMMSMDVMRLVDETLLVRAGKSGVRLSHHHPSCPVECEMTFGAAVACGRRVFDTGPDTPSGSTAFAPFRPLGIKSRLIGRTFCSSSTSLDGVISIRRLVTVHFLIFSVCPLRERDGSVQGFLFFQPLVIFPFFRSGKTKKKKWQRWRRWVTVDENTTKNPHAIHTMALFGRWVKQYKNEISSKLMKETTTKCRMTSLFFNK